MVIFKIILLLVGFLVLLFFANLNNTMVSLYYGAQSPVEFPLFFVVLISFVIGMMVAWIIGFLEKFRLKGELRALRKEKKRTEGELNSLRNMPIVERPSTKMPEGNAPDSTKGNG